MAEFRCKGTDKNGKQTVITVEANNEMEAFRICSGKGFDAYQIREYTAPAGRGKFPGKVLPDFTDMMALMLNAGLTLKDAIDISINPDSKNDKLIALLSLISSKMKSGTSFPDILQEIGRPFTPFYIGMVRIGEKLGKLEEIFDRLAVYIKDRKTLRDKLINALIYPCIVLSMLVIGVFFLVFYLFPSLNETMSSVAAGGQGMNTSISSVQQGLYVVAGILIAIIAYAIFYFIWGKKITALRSFMQGLSMKFPLVGKIVKTRELMSFAFSMETLTESGYTIEAALEQSKQVIHLTPLLDGISRIQEGLLRGSDLSRCFAQADVFPAIFERWTMIGEKTGSVSSVFSKLKSYYTTELENSTNRVMGLIEPLIIVFVGIIMVFAIITIVLPMLDLYSVSL